MFVTNSCASSSSSSICVAHCSVQNCYSHCVLVSFFEGPTDRHLIFYVLSKLPRNLLPSDEECELSALFSWDSLETNCYVLKFFYLLKGTNWKGDSKLPYLEMRETQVKSQNYFRSYDQEGII